MHILFLTNNSVTAPLVKWLQKNQHQQVTIYSEKLTPEYFQAHDFALVISYNYLFIIPQSILDLLPNRFLNLHISLLPWNRGISPNLWSFLDHTPKGVTIHIIDKGMDTGPVLFQKELYFDETKETLSSTYAKLHKHIQELFKDNWETISSFSFILHPQPAGGSAHYYRDLDKIKPLLGSEGWNIPIPELINRYSKL